ncbi:MAG: fibronectin type III domain-containing protein [Acidimicrobiia bacterium]|nr:fibronectin type III domain-containing protein [Acidimicrobiia bacterium]
MSKVAMSKVAGRPTRAMLIFVALLGLLSALTTVANAQTSTQRFYSGIIDSPTYCINRSLGGPTTYAHDADKDGVAEVCSLPTTRRATVAIQNARELLAMDNRPRFGQLYAYACTSILESYGNPSKEATDECSASRRAFANGARGTDIPPVPNSQLFPQPSSGPRPATFYSGPVIINDTFCANFSLGGPTTYAHDSDGDGVADVCSLPTTRRATIARQNALERLSIERATPFRSLLAGECARIEGRVFEGDKVADLNRDECRAGVPLPSGDDDETGTGSGNGTGTGDVDQDTGTSSSISSPQATRPGTYSKRAAQDVKLGSGNNQITVSWNRPQADDNDQDDDSDPYDVADVLEYVVEYSTSSSMSNPQRLRLQLTSGGTAGTSIPTGTCGASAITGSEYQCRITSLQNLRRYYIRVEANRELPNSTGSSNSSSRDYWTPILSLTPGIAGPPVWVDSDTDTDGIQPLISPEFGQITATWAPPAEGNDAVLTYRIQWGTSSRLANNCSNTASCDQFQLARDTTSYTIPGLTNNRTYYVRVQATTGSGPGTWSYVESIRLSAQSLPNPGRPTNVVVSSASLGNNLKVDWTAPAITDNDPEPTGYRVQWRNLDNNEAWSSQTREASLTGASAPTYTIVGLAPLDRYQVRVLAVNQYAAGPWSSTAQITLGVAGAPHSVNLTPGTTSITAAWTVPTSSPAATNILIQWDTNRSFAARCLSDASCNEKNLTSSPPTYTINGLTRGTEYHVRLRATNSNGPSAWSPVASIRMSTPIAPSSLTVAEDADNVRNLDLSWSYTRETGKREANGFRIQWRRTNSTSWSSRSLSLSQVDYDEANGDTDAAYTLTGLTSGIEYEVRVLARNIAGGGTRDGQWSQPVSATPGTTFIPSSVEIAAGTLDNNNATIEASWTAPSSSITVSGYTVQWRTCGTSGGSCGSWGSTATINSDAATESGYRSTLRNNIFYQARVRTNGSSSSGGNSAYAESAKYKVEVDDNETPRDRTDDTITVTELATN